VRSHAFLDRLVQNQVRKIKLDDTVKPGREVLKKLIELAMGSDRFRNL
jgi:hypothetical protein